MRKRSVKMDRINEDVLRTLSDILRSEGKDPRISPITSITAVEVTTDLKQAKVYISVLGDEEALAGTMAGLKSSSGFLRNRLARELNLRNTPELMFVADTSIAYGMALSKKIDEVMNAQRAAEVEDESEPA